MESVQGVGQLRFGLLYEPSNLDPRLITDPFSLMIVSQILEGLMALRAGGLNTTSCLAERVLPSPDGLSYTVKLRRGITFHDGSLLNAQVVAENFAR